MLSVHKWGGKSKGGRSRELGMKRDSQGGGNREKYNVGKFFCDIVHDILQEKKHREEEPQ